MTSYSNSQGVQLLERAVNEFGPIFTLEQISSLPNHQSLTPQQIRKLVSKLAQSGWIEILKRGTYAVKSPLYSGDIPPFAIANALVQPMAISHWSALAHHGFTTQNPAMTQASTPTKVVTPEMRSGKAYRPRGRACWRAFGLEFEFIYVKRDRFWGFQKYWVKIMEDVLSQIDLSRLITYALRYDVGAGIKRLGWLLEKMGADANLILPLKNFPVTGTILLDPNQPRSGKLDPSWQINENLKRS